MNYKSLPDEILLVYLRTGDELAFRAIYQRYWKKLYSIALRKVESVEIVEEIVQDIFLKLWERRDNLRVEHLEAYLFTAVRYAIINHIKATIIHEKYADYIVDLSSEAVNTTDEQLKLNELMSVVERQLNDLPDKTQQIFRLNRLEHHSIKEISSRLKVPERTVEYHLSQAIKTLRVYLRDYLPALAYVYLSWSTIH
ncbi:MULTISPECIES: RNA polymerase sigma-70 factor [unclassified Spirosoma]|uniref:RNA polymerase sigma-70 factor n=1 Tax=unclassified Spirosoma TaxID=2621999 RepID=UPI0009675029|nr:MULTISPECIES: RNA polymerase sigma-70 factor [unclassified Spirosoma]MBN8824555.1 RNA polymerase sigma-70 factor [Spirosoma sp.]OJW70920.1 MAG: RNA polymerase sigma-70 factor [Spirosoma sp. 48-14]